MKTNEEIEDSQQKEVPPPKSKPPENQPETLKSCVSVLEEGGGRGPQKVKIKIGSRGWISTLRLHDPPSTKTTRRKKSAGGNEN